VFKSVSAVETLDDLQLPELAAGYCTSESDLRHIVNDDRRYDTERSTPVSDLSQSSDESLHDNAETFHIPAASSSQRLQQKGSRLTSSGDDRRSRIDNAARLLMDDYDDDGDNSSSSADEGVTEFEQLELAFSANSLDSVQPALVTERSQNTARSQTYLPTYVRRNASGVQISPDQSPDRATGNFHRTYTVRQSKRGREMNNNEDSATFERTRTKGE
jgi:hypothetical protein